jgi:hypothetical protein
VASAPFSTSTLIECKKTTGAGWHAARVIVHDPVSLPGLTLSLGMRAAPTWAQPIRTRLRYRQHAASGSMAGPTGLQERHDRNKLGSVRESGARVWRVTAEFNNGTQRTCR